MAEAAPLFCDRLSSPIGELLLAADGEGRLRRIRWAETAPLEAPKGGLRLEPRRGLGGLTAALDRYFRGDFSAIDTMPVETGGTPFQRAVWSALRGIPCGTTTSYSDLARKIGRPNAVRAVGLANGANPIPIVVPCHRVVGADGTLTGYGGGLDRKRWLLAHEAAAEALPLWSA